MSSEIVEDEDDLNYPMVVDKEFEKSRIRQIIDHQKSQYLSSSPSSSFSSSSTSSFSYPRRSRSSLLDLMKGGSTSLGRLFHMEHTSLGNYLMDYSVSPTIKPILLWGSGSDDNDNIHVDPWAEMKQMKDAFDSIMNGQVGGFSSQNVEVVTKRGRTERTMNRKLYRVKSYRRLPRFSFWKFGVFRFRLKLIKRLRVIIKGIKF